MPTTGFTTGDSSPALTGKVNADITGATAIELHLKKPDNTMLTRAAAVADGPAGKWKYDWQAGEIDVPGEWQAEVQVTFAGGGIQTFGPDKFPVRKQLA